MPSLRENDEAPAFDADNFIQNVVANPEEALKPGEDAARQCQLLLEHFNSQQSQVTPIEEELSADSDDSESDEDEEEDDDGEKELKKGSGKGERRVRFADEKSDDDDSEDEDYEEKNDAYSEKPEKQAKGGKGLEDGFFDLADMEAFAEEAETLALDGRLAGSDDDEEDEHSEDGLTFSADGRDKSLCYGEFFAPPKTEDVDDARALRRATVLDEGSEDEVEESEKTPLELARVMMHTTIEEMEDASVAKRPWQLRGEVSASARPKNSALDGGFQHDIGVRDRAAFVSASAEEIEGLIRQRVHDGLFDNPVRVLPQQYRDAKAKKEVPEVSQEKPSVGLGELYAEEFAQARAELSKASEAEGVVQAQEEVEENEEQKSVSKLCATICRKLDALSSMHFTPELPEDIQEMEVKPNVPALAAEEAVPEVISDAALLAPAEVHRSDKKNAVGELERSKKDRKRARSNTKKRLRELNRERTTRQVAEEQSDPVLANERRAKKALERRGKKKMKLLDKEDGKQSKWTKSGRYFADLQKAKEEVGSLKKRPAPSVAKEVCSASLKL